MCGIHLCWMRVSVHLHGEAHGTGGRGIRGAYGRVCRSLCKPMLSTPMLGVNLCSTAWCSTWHRWTRDSGCVSPGARLVACQSSMQTHVDVSFCVHLHGEVHGTGVSCASTCADLYKQVAYTCVGCKSVFSCTVRRMAQAAPGIRGVRRRVCRPLCKHLGGMHLCLSTWQRACNVYVCMERTHMYVCGCMIARVPVCDYVLYTSEA